jgi:hypothetical protein
LLKLTNILRPEILPAKLERVLIKYPVCVLLLAPALLPIVEILKQVDKILEKLNLNTVKVLHLKPFLPIPRHVRHKDSIKYIITKHSLSCNDIYNIFKINKIFNAKEEVLPEYLVKKPYHKTKYLTIEILARTV